MTKILIIRFSSIGDIVLTTPVIRNLKNQIYGGAEIHYLTKKQFSSIVETNPYIDKVISIEKSTNEVIDSLKAENYQYIIDLHKNLRSARVKRALKTLAFSYDKLNVQKWLWVNLGINRMPDVHIVDRYMQALKTFEIKNDNRGLDYFVPEHERLSATDLPEPHREGFIAIGIGAAHWRKRPNLEQYIALCNKLPMPVALLGGPDEKEFGNQIAQVSGQNIWNAAGAISIHGSAEILRMSRMVITPDTGIMHIAAALKKPIVSIWAATMPDFGMYPYQNNALSAMVQPIHLKKRPCSKLGTKCKYKSCRCVDEIPMERVAEIVKRELGEG